VKTVDLCSEQNIKPDTLSETAQHDPPFRWCLVCVSKCYGISSLTFSVPQGRYHFLTTSLSVVPGARNSTLNINTE